MGIFFRLAPILVTFLAVACVKTTAIHTPDLTMPEIKIPKFEPTDYSTCNKTDAEQPLTDEALKNRIIVQDQIENEDIESVGCDENLIGKSHGPVRLFKKTVVIPAPEGLQAEVSSVEVRNFRTCTKRTIDGSKDRFYSYFSSMTPTGELELQLTDSTSIFFPALNVREGNNVMEIRYLGKCLKYRPERERENTRGDAYNCLRAEELATKSLVLEVDIDRPEVAGVLRVKQCNK